LGDLLPEKGRKIMSQGSRRNALNISRRSFIRSAAAVGIAAPAIMRAGHGAWAKSDVLRIQCDDSDQVEVQWYKDVIATFEKNNPGLSIELEAITMALSMQKLTAQIAAGDAPDMFRSLGLASFATIAEAGLLDPVDDIVDALGRKDFQAPVLDAFTFDGRTMAVPEVSFATVAWYRKDLAEKAGVKPPTNWDELLTFAKATTQDGVYGFVLPVGGTYFTTRILHMFIRQNGGFVVV
jgi:ABC-type glycerol-3-phosphate transport system substrate-binding protein